MSFTYHEQLRFPLLDLELTIEALKRTVTDTNDSLQNTERILSEKESELQLALHQLKAAEEKVSNTKNNLVFCGYSHNVTVQFI